MVLKMEAENLCQLVENAVLYYDIGELLNFLTSDKVLIEDVDHMIKQIGESTEDCLCNLPEKVEIVTNILQLVAEFILVIELDVEQTAYLSRYMVLLASDEDCSIPNIKRAANILNNFLSNLSVGALLVEDESLQTPIQNLGQRIPFTGDFECQALIFEALCRLASNDNTKAHLADIWFSSEKIRSFFLNLNPQQLELECRKILNYANRNAPTPRIFSFVATSVSFGNFQLRKPHGSDFWIDFNYCSQSISFYCSDISDVDSDCSSWETILIPVDIIANYKVSDQTGMKVKVLLLDLNCSCSELIPASSTPSEFNSTEVRITFWSFLDISGHLIKLLGQEDMTCIENSQNNGDRKISVCSDIVYTDCELQNTENNCRSTQKVSEVNELKEPEELRDENSCKRTRKISEVNGLVEIKEVENSKKVSRKISEVDELMETQEVEIPMKRMKSIPEVNEQIKLDEIKEAGTALNSKTISVFEGPVRSDIEEAGTISKSENMSVLQEPMRSDAEKKSEMVDPKEINSTLIHTFDQVSSDKESLQRDGFLQKEQSEKKKTKPSSKKGIAKGRSKRSHSNGCLENSYEDFVPQTVPSKKPRVAALKAMKMNKIILEQKDSEKSSACTYDYKEVIETTIKDTEQDKLIHSPIKKKTKAGSLFCTDTEKGSSEVSWYKKAKHGLFQTPPAKNYCRKSIKKQNETKSKGKKKRYSRKENSKKKQTMSIGNKSSDSENKSRSMRMSDIENHSLVIEAKKPPLTTHTNLTPLFQFDLATSVTETRSASVSNRNSNQNFTDEVGSCPSMKSCEDSKLVCDKTELEFKNKRSDLQSMDPINDASEKNTDSSANISKKADDICYSDQNSLHENKNKLKSAGKQRTLKNNENEIQSRNPLLKNRSTSEDTLVESSSVMHSIHSNKRSPTSGFDSETKENVCKNLSFESLSSLPDEASGKDLQMKRFLESISSASPLPVDTDLFSPPLLIPAKRLQEHCHTEDGSPNKKHRTNSFGLNEEKLSCQKTQRKKDNKINKRPADPIPKNAFKSGAIHSSTMEKQLLKAAKKQHIPKVALEKDNNSLRSYDNTKKNKTSYINTITLSEDWSLLNTEKHGSHSVFAILAIEVKRLTRRLFGTLQKCAWDFNAKVTILRKNLLTTVEGMVACNANLSKKDLKNLAQNCEESRLQIQKNMKQLLDIGREYFEAERKSEDRLKRLHKKVSCKYITSVLSAEEEAVKSVEERIISRARSLFKSFLKKLEFI